MDYREISAQERWEPTKMLLDTSLMPTSTSPLLPPLRLELLLLGNYAERKRLRKLREGEVRLLWRTREDPRGGSISCVPLLLIYESCERFVLSPHAHVLLEADSSSVLQVLPLHPLTMEDIIHQETREKIETFPTLGYYFIVFRALDESYFKYTSSDATPATAENLQNASTAKPDTHSSALPGSTKRARVDFIEGVGGKEGVEGVGVGAVNLYLIVFRDGIVSVSPPCFEP